MTFNFRKVKSSYMYNLQQMPLMSATELTGTVT